MGDLLQLPVRHDPWMSKQRLARHWRVSPRTIERYVVEGLPSSLINGRRFFKLRAAEKWRSERCHEHAARAAV